MKAKKRLSILFLLISSVTAVFGADDNEAIVIDAFKKSSLNYEIVQQSRCRYKMSALTGAANAPIKIRMVRNYSFANLESAEVFNTIALQGVEGNFMDLMAKSTPYTVRLRGQELFRADTWFEPNPYNVPPKFGFPGSKDLLYFKTEDEARLFALAIRGLSITCDKN